MKFKHFISLNALDVLTTWYGLTYLGLTELNTFANGLFQENGLIISLIGLKLSGLIVICICLELYPIIIKHYKLNIDKVKITKAITNIGCFIFMFVVANNIYQIIDFYR